VRSIDATAYLVPGSGDRPGRLRISLECERRAEYGYEHPALGEHAHEPPEARAAAVFVDRFDDQVALAGADRRSRYFGKIHFGGLVTIGNRVLRALFVIHHDLYGEARATGPGRLGRVRSVSDEVARICALSIPIVHAMA
jgi:hypothetical protein